MENCPKYKVKQSKNGSIPQIIRLAQSISKRKFLFVDKPFVDKPSERAFEKYKARGLPPLQRGPYADLQLPKLREAKL